MWCRGFSFPDFSKFCFWYKKTFYYPLPGTYIINVICERAWSVRLIMCKKIQFRSPLFCYCLKSYLKTGVIRLIHHFENSLLSFVKNVKVWALYRISVLHIHKWYDWSSEWNGLVINSSTLRYVVVKSVIITCIFP